MCNKNKTYNKFNTNKKKETGKILRLIRPISKIKKLV
jgi:hypothetical protein